MSDITKIFKPHRLYRVYPKFEQSYIGPFNLLSKCSSTATALFEAEVIDRSK